MSAIPTSLAALARSPVLRHSRSLLTPFRTLWWAHVHDVPTAPGNVPLAIRFELSPAQESVADSAQQTNRLESRASPPPIELHVAGDDGHGLHHVASRTCQERTCRERVAGACQYAQTNMAPPRSPSSARATRMPAWLMPVSHRQVLAWRTHHVSQCERVELDTYHVHAEAQAQCPPNPEGISAERCFARPATCPSRPPTHSR